MTLDHDEISEIQPMYKKVLAKNQLGTVKIVAYLFQK